MGDDIIDPELRDTIIETHTDMKHVRRTLQDHDDVIEEIRNQHDERIRALEQTQSRIMAYIVLIGAGITLAMNAALDVLEKIWK